MFAQLKIILINTTHPGNIGAVARAMKNMGFRELCLVSPKEFPSEVATARASGAEDILQGAMVVQSLEDAVADCHRVFGLSARLRKISMPLMNSRRAALEIEKLHQDNPTQKIALVFGQEQSGLSNEALAKCHYQVLITAEPSFASLNLAQAVQIMVYELRMAGVGVESEGYQQNEMSENSEELATAEAVEGFYAHLEKSLIQIGFLNPQMPGHLMHYLRRLFAKSRLTNLELNILRGILTSIQKRV